MKQLKPENGVYVSIVEMGHLFLPDEYWIERWENAEMFSSFVVPTTEKEYMQELISSAKDAIITPYAKEYLNGKE